MRRFFAALIACSLTSLPPAVAAQSAEPKLEPLPPPPLPRQGGLNEPRVDIPVQQDDEVEVVRDAGRVIMIRVKPKNGPVYYLLDPSGNGNWERRSALDTGLRVPMWSVFEFD